jgi:hypothetical protein
MNGHLVTIDITDEASLLNACDILHDSRCDLSTLHVDLSRGTWNAKFEREFFEDPDAMKHERKLLFFIKTTFPMAETELTLTGLKSYRIEDNADIGIFMFNECQINGSIATLLFCENMKMILEFESKPQGKLIDVKLLDKTGSMYTTGVKKFKERCQPTNSPYSSPAAGSKR